MPRALTLTEIETPVGALTLLLDGETVLICEFADRQTRVEQQIERFYTGCTITAGECPPAVAGAFKAYFESETSALGGLKSHPEGTAYEERVWRALKDIPAGETSSYGALAKTLGSSARAVGRANGRNPVALIHPCHRVIGADGSLTGYAGGLERKEWLLRHEGALMALPLSA